MVATMRNGPYPLSVHIALAAWTSPQQEGGDPGVNPRMARMLEGIRAYQAHPFKRQASALETVWQSGEVRLLRQPAGAAEGQESCPLIVVPSMINDSAILDLLPERSFLKWMAGQGCDIRMLDWGMPCSDADMGDMSSLVCNKIIPALEEAARQAGRPLCGIGYCMGGLLLLAAASRRPELFSSLIFLASPWDFHTEDDPLARRIQGCAPLMMPAVEERGVLPAGWLQIIFAMVDPDMTIRKFSDFAAMEPDSEEALVFIAVEDWLASGADLPGRLATECVRDWYFYNLPARGAWSVGGAVIDPGAIKCPVLIAGGTRDRLVPHSSAVALRGAISHAEIFAPDCGHVGLMAGRNSVAKVWAALKDWIDRSDAP